MNRWFKNLERGSPITAEVALKRLSRICEILNLNPDDIIITARNDLTAFQDMMEDLVSKLETEHKSPGYIGGFDQNHQVLAQIQRRIIDKKNQDSARATPGTNPEPVIVTVSPGE